MRILLIEDDPKKLKALMEYVDAEYPQHELETRMSYQSGLKAILTNKFQLILLDMQLPNYDIKSGEDGYKHRAVAGKDILREIKRKNINCKVIIITQYDSFTENGRISSLQEWRNAFTKEFPNHYLEIVFYKPGLSAWKNRLKELITTIT
ncbi:response regulator [Mucilaginibacter sp. AW1-7]|uniref:response regulator n=1 Tax=Mucilaginibacter sp. AW1-7 TaxID=3349874 RepID=UPI003F7390B1